MRVKSLEICSTDVRYGRRIQCVLRIVDVHLPWASDQSDWILVEMAQSAFAVETLLSEYT